MSSSADRHKTYKEIDALTERGAVKELGGYLGSTDTNTIVAALQGIETILLDAARVGKAQRAMVEDELQPLLDQIEELQAHVNESVFHAARKVLLEISGDE